MTVVVGVSLSFGGGQIASAEELHTAQQGDTITFIAEAHGVSVDALAAANGLDPAAELYAGQNLTIPDGSTASVTAADGGSSSTLLDGVFAYQQARSLSCEYASVFIATSVFGNPIYEEEYLGSTPSSANPHYGFRGNIDGPWGVTDDYGIYAEALVPLLEQYGYVGEVSYDPRAEALQAQLDMGKPTIVWIATRGDTGFYETDETGTYKLVPYEHVVVAYGYDNGGVYISDPGNASLSYYSWDWFLPAWSVMDGMALSVYPA